MQRSVPRMSHSLVLPLALLLLLLGSAAPVRADEDGSGSGDGSGWDVAPLLCLPPARWDGVLGLCVTDDKGDWSRGKAPMLLPGAAEEDGNNKGEMASSQERDYWKEDNERWEKEEVEETEEDELEHAGVQAEKITSLLEEINDEEEIAHDPNTFSFTGSKLWLYASVGLVTIAGTLAVLAVTIKYRKSAVAAIKESSLPNHSITKLLRKCPESKPILDEQEERLV
ncbi:uncharacterized protein LOC133348557 isoform X2 [Lethenteron reissneri]|uniref:uncharacterized protein LOC133348557 isoform X2 n=1 Tax=Lethenteron reissneri TaxID=7753 RepID=UPI002AB6CAF4|nr:uncharacterized protein LOC133348557 isoform X2 [Lethenteron reissneri]